MQAKDPSLNELAVQLKRLEWITPLDPEELEECQEKMAVTPDADAPGGIAIPKRRLVHPLPGCVHWNVRMYLGGEQRTLGIVHARNVENAFRFADMAQQYFWKYRVRGRPPSRLDLNLSPERVEADMANEVNAVNLLRQIEDYLLQIGALQTSEQRHAERRAKKEQRKQGGLKATITRGLLDLQTRANESDEKFEGIGTWLQQLDDKLTALAERVNSMDASLGKVLTRVVQDLDQIKRAQAGIAIDFRPPAPQKDAIGWPLPAPATGDPLPPNPTTVC